VTGVITGSDNASITISASPATVSLASNIVTAGNAITIDNGSGGNTAVVLGKSTTLDTTNGGAVTTGAAVTIRFAAPEYGVAPGQAAVIYAGERVIGGGWIDATEKVTL
jgi:tRNA-specific 2-thiouridylase